MTASSWVAAGALCCAVSVIAGAFGAHGLQSRLDADALALWETAARYFMYSGIGVVLIGLFGVSQAAGGVAARGIDAAGICLLIGGLIFSGTVAVLALGGPRWLGAVTPIGGLLMIAGFVLLAVSALRS